MPSPEKAPAAQGKMTDADFDELGDLLIADWAPEATLDVEGLDGFFAGLICAPRVVLPSAFVPEIFGGEAPEFPDSATAQRFFELVMRRHNEIAEALNAPVERLDDPRAYDPLLVDWDANAEALQQVLPSGEVPPLPRYGELWARGFLRAVDLTSEDWKAIPPDDEDEAQFIEDCLGAILALVPQEDDEAPAEARESAEQRDDLVAEAIIAAYDLRAYWRDVQFEQVRVKEPIRREAKVGRNDPCPCGSGRKFKQCHGRGH